MGILVWLKANELNFFKATKKGVSLSPKSHKLGFFAPSIPWVFSSHILFTNLLDSLLASAPDLLMVFSNFSFASFTLVFSNSMSILPSLDSASSLSPCSPFIFDGFSFRPFPTGLAYPEDDEQEEHMLSSSTERPRSKRSSWSFSGLFSSSPVLSLHGFSSSAW